MFHIAINKIFEFKKDRVYAEVVCISKDNKELSGDSYKIIELDEGKFILHLAMEWEVENQLLLKVQMY